MTCLSFERTPKVDLIRLKFIVFQIFLTQKLFEDSFLSDFGLIRAVLLFKYSLVATDNNFLKRK